MLHYLFIFYKKVCRVVLGGVLIKEYFYLGTYQNWSKINFVLSRRSIRERSYKNVRGGCREKSVKWDGYLSYNRTKKNKSGWQNLVGEVIKTTVLKIKN